MANKVDLLLKWKHERNIVIFLKKIMFYYFFNSSSSSSSRYILLTTKQRYISGAMSVLPNFYFDGLPWIPLTDAGCG